MSREAHANAVAHHVRSFAIALGLRRPLAASASALFGAGVPGMCNRLFTAVTPGTLRTACSTLNMASASSSCPRRTTVVPSTSRFRRPCGIERSRKKRAPLGKLRPLTCDQVSSPGQERVEPVSGLARQTPARHSNKVTRSFNNPDAPSLAVVRVEKIGRHCRTRGQHRCSDPRSLCHAINTPVVTA